ncbi:MAG: S-layer homology domain-containing protein, partial [Neofamilia sp.]
FIQTPNGETITTTVDENGKWTIDLDAPLILSEKIIVKSQEENKDLSEEVTVEVMKKKEEDIPTQPKPPTPPLPPVEPVEPKPIPDFPIDRNYLDILFESSPKSIPTIKTPVVNMITENHSSYINGYSDGSFKGDRSITRSEVAILISKLKGFNTLDNSKPNFSDMDLNYWANGAINAMLKEGLMKGYPDGTFRPNSSITRGEIAQILISMDNKNSGINPFKDTRDHWAEDAITHGYLNDRIKGYEDGTFRPDNPITRAEVVTMMNRMFNRKTNNSSIENIFIQSPFNDIDNSHWAYYEILEGAINHTSQRENLDEYEIWQTVNN